MSLFRRPPSESLSCVSSIPEGSSGALPGIYIAFIHLRPAHSDTFKRASNPSLVPDRYMRVNHGCLNIRVTKQFLNRSNIIPIFQKMRREAVSQCMRRSQFRNPRHLNPLPDFFLQNRRMDMPERYLPGPCVRAGTARREKPVPAPILRQSGILLSQRFRQKNAR